MREDELSQTIERVGALAEAIKQHIKYKSGYYNRQGLGIGLSIDQMMKARTGPTDEEIAFLHANKEFIADSEVLEFLGEKPEAPSGSKDTVAIDTKSLEISEEDKAVNRIRHKIDVLMSKKKMGIAPSKEETLSEEEVALFLANKGIDADDIARWVFLDKRGHEEISVREAQQAELKEKLKILTDMMRPEGERRMNTTLSPDGIVRTLRLVQILGVELHPEVKKYLENHVKSFRLSGDASGGTQMIDLKQKPPEKKGFLGGIWDKLRGK